MVLLVALATVFLFVQIAITDYLQPVNWKGKEFDLSTLKYVTVISRHGSRSPYWSYPKDCCPFNDTRFWPDGLLQLTKYGKRQSYESGRNFRQRYDGFVNAIYFPYETLFLSNIDDREFCSAQLIAAGMFPPTRFQIWNENLLWQPISVFPMTQDPVHTRYFCPRFVEMSNVVTKALFAELAKDNAEFLKEVAYFTGLEPEKVLPRMFNIWQNLELERENGYPNPEWADVKFLNRLFGLAARISRETTGGTEDMKQMIAGPVLSSIVEELNNKSSSALFQRRKMTIFTTHDITIVVALLGLGINEPLLPQTASSLAFELHSSANGPIIQVLYFNHSSIKQPTLFEVPGCPNPCPLDKFTEIAERYNPKNLQFNCSSSKSTTTRLNLSMTLLISAIVKLVLAFV